MTIGSLKKLFFLDLPKDTTKKQIQKDILKIAFPSLVELVLVQLCTIIDNIMVGQLGSSELASVAYCTQPKFLLLCTFIALNIGTTALIARFKGMEDQKSAAEALKQSLLITFILSFIISIIGYIFAEDMVIFMGAENDFTISNGTIYMQIQMLGFVFNALSLTITAGLRGIGHTKVSMYYNIGANIINVIFNFLLIYGNFGFPKLGVSGASLATVIGQTVAAIVAFYVISKRTCYLHFNIKKIFIPNFKILKRLLNIGIPSMFEQFALRFGLIIYACTVSSLGESIFTAHQIGLNIMGVSFMNGQAFGISATSLIGQSLGKNRPDMAYSYTFLCRKYGMYISILIGIFLLLFSDTVFRMFTSDEFIIASGIDIIIFLAINQPFQSSQLVISGALRGAGDTRLVAISTLVGILLVRPLTSIIAVRYLGLGLPGAWAAIILDQILRCIIVFIRFGSGKWINIRV